MCACVCVNVYSYCFTDYSVSEFTEVFRLIDADGDGVISAGELGGAMRRVGLTPTEAQVQDLVSMHAASDHADGGAEQSEFIYVHGVHGKYTHARPPHD